MTKSEYKTKNNDMPKSIFENMHEKTQPYPKPIPKTRN